MSFRSRQFPGRRALLTLALLLLSVASAAAGLRDVRVVGEAPVRSWAARTSPAVEVVRTGGFVTLEGSVEAPWYRVRTTAGKVGWIAGTLSEDLLSADEGLALKPTEFSGSLRLLTPAGLRGGPVAGRPVQHELAAGSIVRVLDQYGTWILLGDAQGRSGWAEASTFVAAVVPADATAGVEPEQRVAEARQDAAASEPAAGPTGADLREQRLAERRAKKEAAAAESAAAEDARQAKKEKRRLEAERREAERAAEAASSEAAAEEQRIAAAEAKRVQDEKDRLEAEQREAEKAEALAQAEAEAESRRVKKEAQRLELEREKAQQEAERAREALARQVEEANRSAERAAQLAAEAAAARAAADAAPPTAKELKAAERRAAREAKEAEREAERLALAAAAAEKEAAREAEAAEERAAREAVAAEKRVAREAAAAEKQAARDAAAAKKQARTEVAAAEKPAPVEAADPSVVTGEDEFSAAELKRRERAAAAARKEEKRLAEAAEKRAAREAKEAERLAKKEAKKRGKEEPVRVAAAPTPVQEIPTGPVAPADIPPSLGVSLDKKAPAEKKADPGRSPLWSEAPVTRDPTALPVFDPVVEKTSPQDPAAAELLEGFQPYDEKAQVDRSVDAVHDDPEKALGLSFAERPTAKASSYYVNDQGDMVNTRIVSEIVLRVGSEILTLGEFDRRVAETVEAESVRSGAAMSLDEARRRVMGELVEALVLIHQGRAIGIRFDAVYESAKEDFKKSGGISDDLELLRLLDEMDMTFKDFRREMIRRTVPRLVLRTQVMSDVTVAEDEIDNYYRRHQDEWEQEDCVFLRELVLQPEARETTRDFNLRLEEILKRVEAGEDFCDLARRHSRSPSAAKCGQLGDCFSFDQLDEKVARVVFKMRPGDVEPIRTDWGFHLLRLEEHRPRRVRSFDEVRDAIVRKLQIEKVQGEIPRYLQELLRTVRVEISPGFERYWDDLNARGGLGQ